MKKNTILMTKIFMLAVFTIVVIYDIVVATNGLKGDTISEITLFYSFRIAFIPWALGYLSGHLTFPWRKEPFPIWVSLPAGVLIGVLLTIIVKVIQLEVMPVLWLVLGLPAGGWLWTQGRK